MPFSVAILIVLWSYGVQWWLDLLITHDRREPSIDRSPVTCLFPPSPSLSMQYVSPRYNGDVAKAYEELVGCRKEVQASLLPDTLRKAYVHFFGDSQRHTKVNLVRKTEKCERNPHGENPRGWIYDVSVFSLLPHSSPSRHKTPCNRRAAVKGSA